MGHRRADDMSITVRLRPDLVERLKTVCDARTVGRRAVIEHALENYLDFIEQEWNL
jgi:predicted transcriptional regulator